MILLIDGNMMLHRQLHIPELFHMRTEEGRIPTGGLFGTLDSSKLSASTYGILVIRDIDGSCTSDNPVINERDLVVLMVNTTQCFSGIGTRTDVFGYVHPEYGVSGVIAFTTPSVYVDTIIDLQP